MEVLVINGNPDTESQFEEYLRELAVSLEHRRHRVTTLAVREMVIAECQRCFGCWVRTPGECLLPDQSELLRQHFVGSDMVLFASPLLMGYPTALTQKAIDRLLPTLLPYWESTETGVRHERRYDKVPVLGVLLHAREEVDSEDLSILDDLFASIAHQLGTTVKFILFSDIPAHEVAYEIHRL
jgi:multimeric flavodoxin WrbA